MSDDTAPPDETAEVATNLLGRALLEALVDELQVQPDSWGKMTQAQQEQAINRMRVKVKQLLQDTMSVLLAGRFPACVASLDRVVFTGGIKAILSVEKGARSRHEMADGVGKRILVVMADPEEYLKGMEEIKARATQRDLFEESKKKDDQYDPSADQPGYRSDEPAADPGRTWADVNDLLAGADSLELDPGSPKPLWQQAVEILEKVHVLVWPEIAQHWTEQECMVAFAWAKAMLDNPEAAPARPHWLPLPTPPEAGEGDDPDDESALLFGSAAEADDPASDDQPEEPRNEDS